MDSLKPADIVSSMVQAGAAKAQLGPFDLLIRGCLSGALLGFATSLAIGATVQTGQILVGALIFPVGFVMIVLLGLELVTGSFAVLPHGAVRPPRHARPPSHQLVLGVPRQPDRQRRLRRPVRHRASPTPARSIPPASPSASARSPNSRPLGYAHFGAAGMLTVFVKAILCNWMVCFGVVMAMSLHLHHRPHRRRLDADPGLLRPGLRAFGGQHVHHPRRHDDGRQGQLR